MNNKEKEGMTVSDKATN